MKKATWSDIDRCMNHGTLADQDRETLEAFSHVIPDPSTNTVYHHRFQSAKEIIRDRLRQIESQDKTGQSPTARWHDHPMGKIAIGAISAAIGGIVVFVLTQLLKHGFPFLK